MNNSKEEILKLKTLLRRDDLSQNLPLGYNFLKEIDVFRSVKVTSSTLHNSQVIVGTYYKPTSLLIFRKKQ